MHKRNFKKTIATIGMSAALLFALSGCEMIYTIGLEINKDGSAELTNGMLMDKELYEGLSEYSDEGDSDLSDVEEVKRGKKKYYYIEGDDSEEFDDLDEATEFFEDEMEDAFQDIKITNKSFEATFDPEAFMDAQEDSSELEEYDTDIGIEFSVTFPKKISKTNGELSEDKKTVTWSITDMDEECEMYAKCSSVSVPVIIAIVLCCIIIPCGAYFVITASKKNKNNDDDTVSTSNTTSNSVPAYTPAVNDEPVEADTSRFAPPASDNTASVEADPAAPIDNDDDEL